MPKRKILFNLKPLKLQTMIPKIWKILNEKDEKTFCRYAYLNKEEIVATNSHALVIHKNEEIFPEFFVHQIRENDQYFIPIDCLKEMNKKGVTYWMQNKDGKDTIVVSKQGKEKTFQLLDGSNYVKYKHVIPENLMSKLIQSDSILNCF